MHQSEMSFSSPEVPQGASGPVLVSVAGTRGSCICFGTLSARPPNTQQQLLQGGMWGMSGNDSARSPDGSLRWSEGLLGNLEIQSMPAEKPALVSREVPLLSPNRPGNLVDIMVQGTSTEGKEKAGTVPLQTLVFWSLTWLDWAWVGAAQILHAYAVTHENHWRAANLQHVTGGRLLL